MILNLDDYHNIHTKRRADTTTTSDVHHFQTILLKAVPELFFPHLWLTYNERKSVFANELSEAKTHEECVEMLLVHNYDNRIQQHKEDRSMANKKLVNLVEGSLHSIEDYIKALQIVLLFETQKSV